MKRLSLSLLTSLLAITLTAQVPQGINYQAVARDSQGNVLSESTLTVRIGVLQGVTLLWQEDHNKTTTDLGQFSLQIGDAAASKTGGSLASFSDIPWGSGNFSLKVSINSGAGFVDLGTSPISSVPFAFYAENAPDMQTLELNGTSLSISNGNEVDLASLQSGGFDGDSSSTNELQDLSYVNGKLSLTNDPSADSIDLISLFGSGGVWATNADTLYTTSSVAIGSGSPNQSLLSVQSADPQVEKPLFEVKNDAGVPVFAVYNDGVIVYVDENKKGVKGGFAVGGYNSATKGLTQEFLRITPDSVRIWVPEDVAAKAGKGGFAIGGYNSASKAVTQNLLEVSSSQTSIYFDTTNLAKAGKGGFAIGGYNSATKGTSDQLMSLTRENYLIGKDAGSNITTGKNNTFFGWKAGLNNTEGNENIFIGKNAGFFNLDASENIFVGNLSGYNTESGYGNVYLGNESGYENIEGYYNSIVGYQAGYGNTSHYNTFFGFQAGGNNTTGLNNIAIGFQAGLGFPVDSVGVIGEDNIFIGNSAGAYNAGGGSNVMIGNNAGYSNVDGENNIFIGNDAGFSNNKGLQNVMIGFEAGYSNYGEGGTWDGNYNVFLGYVAGHSNVSGSGNVFLGYFAGSANVTGNYQTAIGHAAGAYATGSDNTFVGAEAGIDAITGTNNTYIGIYAGRSGVGSHNTYLGYAAGFSGEGDNNVLIGSGAGEGVVGTSFSNNTFLGTQAGISASSGSNNVFLGSYAGYSTTTGSGNVFIGKDAGYNETGSNKLYIANSSTSSPLILGDFSLPELVVNGHVGMNHTIYTDVALTIDYPVVATSTYAAIYALGDVYGTAYYTITKGSASSKSATKSIENVLSKLEQVNGYYFESQNKAGVNTTEIGLDSDEIQNVFPELVKKDKEGQNTLNYDGLVPVLIEAIKEQQSQIEAQQKEIDTLKTLILSK